MMTHESGPAVTFGIGKGTSTGVENPDAGPGITYQGDCILDPRTGYAPGQATKVYSFFDSSYILLYNGTPATLSTTNLMNAVASSTVGTSYTITAGTGITSASTVTTQLTGAVVSTTAFAIGAAYTPLTIGRNFVFDPTKAEARAVQIVSSSASDTSAKKLIISGYDVYGQAMSELISFNGVTGVNGKKAFKFITTIVQAGGTGVGNYSVGTTDIFGFHMRSDLWEQMNVFTNQAFVTATTGYTAAVTTNPATTTTGDVRGTYALQSASDGVKRTAFYISISPAQMTGHVINQATSTTSTLFGVTQV